MKKNYKQVISYVIYILLFYLILYLGAFYSYRIIEYSKSTFKHEPMVIYLTFFPIILGLLAALPNLCLEIKKSGKWKMNWTKLIVIGVPSFLIGISLMYLSIETFLGLKIIPDFLSFILVYDTPRILSGFIFGFIILDSIEKHN